MIPGWKEAIERDYLEVLRQHRQASPPELAARLKVSERSVVYWLTALARDGKVRILAVAPAEEGGLPCAPSSPSTCQREVFYPVHV